MPLDTLPTEIVELIVEPLLEDVADSDKPIRYDAICGLKSLRRVSRTAASLPGICRVLFQTLPVYGIPQHVSEINAGLATVQQILPYVSGVSFQAYPFASTIARDEYLVLAPLDRIDFFEQDFEAFLNFARVAEGCLYDQNTAKIWQQLLSSLPNLQDVRIDTTLDQIFLKDSGIWKHFTNRQPVFREDLKSNQSYVKMLGPKTALLCQQMARTVVQCIADMQLALDSLRVAGIFTLSFDWNLVPEIKRVHWGQLTALEIGSHFVFPTNQPDEPRGCIPTLLAQVNHSLKRLTVNLPSPRRELYWPPLTVSHLSLPNVQMLEIRDMPLHGHNFVEFILAHNTLSHITLHNVKSNVPWKVIFDGLRIYPDPLNVTFSDMHMSFLCRQSVRSFKTRPGYSPGVFADNDPKVNLDDSGLNPSTLDKLENIILYIQNYIPWTPQLEDDFGVWHSA